MNLVTGLYFVTGYPNIRSAVKQACQEHKLSPFQQDLLVRLANTVDCFLSKVRETNAFGGDITNSSFARGFTRFILLDQLVLAILPQAFPKDVNRQVINYRPRSHAKELAELRTRIDAINAEFSGDALSSENLELTTSNITNNVLVERWREKSYSITQARAKMESLQRRAGCVINVLDAAQAILWYTVS